MRFFHKIEGKMKKLSISEQCRRAGIDLSTYYKRLKKGVTDPLAPSIRKKYQRMTKELAELLIKNGISKDLYRIRISKGWSEFEAANVLPNSHYCHYHNGKTVRSQLGENKYRSFIKIINNERLSVEEALNRLDNPRSNAKYYRDGIPLTVYCRKHGLNYNKEYRKLMLDRKNANC